MIKKIIRDKSARGYIVGITIGVSIQLLMIFGLINFFFYDRPSVKDREIKYTDSFELNWDISVASPTTGVDDWEYHQYGEQILIHLAENQVILPVRYSRNTLISKTNLTSFSLDSGEVKWQTEIPWEIELMGQNTDHIFVINTRLDRESREAITQKSVNYCVSNDCPHSKIAAYDDQSGKEDWSIFYANANAVDRLFINDDIVSIIAHGRRNGWREEFSLSAQTGEVLPEFQDPTFYIDTSVSYETIITNLGFTNGVLSNFADNGDFIFFLTKNDSTLWAVDKNSLQIAGQVQFNHEPALTLAAGRIEGFSVAASGDTVVVYLGDSEQLFAFHFTPPE